MINTQAFFIRKLFGVFNGADFNYVVLHSWQGLPDVATSDIDMLISEDEKKRLPKLLEQVAEGTGWRFVQKLWYDVPWCFYYVAVSPDGKEAVSLDFVSDPKGLGEYRIKDDALLRHRVFSGLLYHLSREMELAYKIAKRRVKGILSDADYRFLQQYYHDSDIAALKDRLGELLPERSVVLILDMLKRNASIEEMRDFMVRDSPAFVLFNRRWRIKFGVSWFVKTLQRILNRVGTPTGCILYLSGESVRRIGGIKKLAEKQLFPRFVFRRQVIIDGRTARLSWIRKRAALASATLVVMAESAQDGYDVGDGFSGVKTDVLSDVVSAMEARLKW